MSIAVRPSRINRLGFLAWSWATLLVILISAAPDGGAPGSRAIGSAFDPATPALAMGAQQPRTQAIAESDEHAPPASPAGGAGTLIGASFDVVSPDVLKPGAFIAHRSPDSGDARALTRAHGARAPPAA